HSLPLKHLCPSVPLFLENSLLFSVFDLCFSLCLNVMRDALQSRADWEIDATAPGNDDVSGSTREGILNSHISVSPKPLSLCPSVFKRIISSETLPVQI
ncbi:MAG TPA: hypothetical protein PLO35_06505, partial [Candidatus Cloacimonadota bacterium]|nr:hypothetical protein [Candidatus Cloacimonadota bacterium]